MEHDQTLTSLVEMDVSVPMTVCGSWLLGQQTGQMLDPALLRRGRFDRQVKVGPAGQKGRLEILKIHVNNKPSGKM